MKRKLLGAASVLVLTAAAGGIAWSQGAGSQLVTTLSSSYRVPIKAGNGTVNQETTLGTLSAFIGAGPGGGSVGVAGDIQTSDGALGFTALTPGGGIAQWIVLPNSANLRTALTDETGIGVAVFNTSPVLVTPNLGTPSAAVLTNATGLPISGMAAVAANTLLGNPTGSSAIPNTITLGTNLSFSGGVLNAAGGSGTPGGSSGQFQYNNAGVFAGGTVGTGLDLTAGNLTLVTVPNNQSGASYTLQTTDTNKSVNMTNVSATTVTALLAATAGTNYGTYLYCKASCTLTHSGSDTINGGTSLALAAGQAAYLTSDGTSAWTVNILPALDPSNGANLQASTVANAALATMAAHTHKGNNTGSTGAALDLTATQLTADLNAVVGDSGSGGTKGLVPAPAAGDAAGGKVLGAAGGWVSGGGVGTASNSQILYDNAGAVGGLSRQGSTGTAVTMATGAFVPGNALTTDASGNAIDSGVTPGGGGGSGTVSSGTANQLGRYASNGTTITGSATFTDNNSVGAVTKGFALSGEISPTALSGDVDDYAPTGNSTALRLRIDAGGANRNITGLAGGATGIVKIIYNAGTSGNLVLKDENTGSTSAANRFHLGNNDITVSPGKTRAFIYDTTISRWTNFDAAQGNTGVTATTYTNPTIAVSTDGRITSASNGTAGGAWTFVSTLTANNSSGSMAFTGLTGGDYKMVCRNLVPGTINITAGIQFSNAASFITSGYEWTLFGYTIASSPTIAAAGSTSDVAMQLQGTANLSLDSGGISFEIDLLNLAAAVQHRIMGTSMLVTTQRLFRQVWGAYTGGTTAVDGVRVQASSGNWASGTCSLYSLQMS